MSRMPMTNDLPQEAVQKAYDFESENISKFSARISELCKFAWVGALAIFFGLITAKTDGATYIFFKDQVPILFAAAIAGSLAFLFDYLQNIAAYIHAKGLVSWMEKTKHIGKAAFDKRTVSVFSRANTLFFFCKNIAVLISVGLMVYAILMGFLPTLRISTII